MRPRHLISLAFVMILLGMAVWSFYTNVVDPHGSGDPMEGMAMGGESADAAPGEGTAGGAAGGSEVGGGAVGGAGDTGQLASAEAGVVPPSLGGWPLTGLAEGDEARAQVERMHGGDLGSGLEGAWVAQYGDSSSGQSKVTVWISRALEPADARTLFERMTASISEGTSPFTGLRPIEDSQVEGYALDGMGQRHYYFLEGADLYWLSADPAHAETVLIELLVNARRAARG